MTPQLLHVIAPWSEYQPQSFRTDDFAAYYRRVRASLEQAVKLDQAINVYPDPKPFCDVCRWQERCDAKRHADDHLSLVAGTLRNVLELSGLSSYCDYSIEESFARDGNVARPDVVIRLPGGRTIVVDAKTSLSAYLDAIDAVDEAERDRLLALHAAQIRTHVKQLAAKSYWDGLTVTPDFVVMFVPGDNFYAAAVERDPSLFEDAIAQRVIIVTPATLIALAKAVAFGWRQEKVAENAQRVHALGRELYRRMIKMTGHIERCGDALEKSVNHFNQFVGSLENSVMPQARRFNELEVEGAAAELPMLEHIDFEPRQLRSDRDFAEVEPARVAPSLAVSA